jgi:hypothetical protein
MRVFTLQDFLSLKLFVYLTGQPIFFGRVIFALGGLLHFRGGAGS